MNIRFLIFSAILLFIIFASEYIAYASLHHAEIIKSVRAETILMIFGILFPIIFIISVLYSYKNYSLFNSWVNEISSIWLGIMTYVLIASLIIFIIIIANNYFVLQMPIKIITSVLMLIIIYLIVNGIMTANNPRIVNLEINSIDLKKNWSDKKMAIISDVHLGSIKNKNFLKKIIGKIEKENVDVVFILGDLIDGSSFPYKDWLSEFSVLKPQFGILYVEGNHEKYSKEYDYFKSQIPSEIINITNKKNIINNTQIIGIDYKDDESPDDINNELKNLEYNKNQPSIILKHEPKNIKELSKNEVSLVLSGHTHGGQFFPFTIAVKKRYKEYAKGLNYTNNTASFTTIGVGSAIANIRIGANPEIIILKIK